MRFFRENYLFVDIQPFSVIIKNRAEKRPIFENKTFVPVIFADWDCKTITGATIEAVIMDVANRPRTMGRTILLHFVEKNPAPLRSDLTVSLKTVPFSFTLTMIQKGRIS